jgi:hypothetical protein
VTSRFEAEANYTVCFVDADREGSCECEAAGSECPGDSR